MNTHLTFIAARTRVKAGAAVASVLLALAGPACAESRFVIGELGFEVTDTATGLIWRRCSEGQIWTGVTCAGNSISTSWEGALGRAAAAGNGWRLPNVKELASLLDHGLANPAIDPVAFPRTPVSSFWTSTPFASFPNYAWAVGFQIGMVTSWHMDIGYRVRLVRAGN